MRLLIIVFCICLAQFSFSQSKLNRAYMQLEYGFTRHLGAGVTVHTFGHLSTALSYSRTRYQHEEYYLTPKNALVNDIHRLYDVHEKYNFLIGATTKNLDILDMSLMFGPSYIEHKMYSNIEVKETYDYSSGTTTKYFDYDLTDMATFGLAARADFAFSLSNYVGLNIAVEGSFNELHNIYKVLVGLNFGLTRDLNKLQNK